jgi:hypothetical protein
MFQNKTLTRTFAHKRNRVTVDSRELHSEELHNLHSSPNSIRVIKSGRMRLVGNVARTAETRDAYKISAGENEQKRLQGNQVYMGG